MVALAAELRAEEEAAAPPPAPASREQLRSPRRREVRSRTVNVGKIPKREVLAERARLEELERVDPLDVERPRTRGDCEGAPRPCPFVACRHHLFLEVARNGSIKLRFPDLEPWELRESCALDVADRGGETLEAVGELMNLTRERVRQVELFALVKLEARLERRGVAGELAGGRKAKRRLPIVE